MKKKGRNVQKQNAMMACLSVRAVEEERKKNRRSAPFNVLERVCERVEVVKINPVCQLWSDVRRALQ